MPQSYQSKYAIKQRSDKKSLNEIVTTPDWLRSKFQYPSKASDNFVA